jgi:hypothetical protein
MIEPLSDEELKGLRERAMGAPPTSITKRTLATIDALQARLRKANCEYGDGWLSEDLECQVDVEPWCGKHAVLFYIQKLREVGE